MKKNKSGELIDAIYRKDLGAIARLLEEGVDPNERDPHGRTPIMYAILSFEPALATIDLLLNSGADINLSDNEQKWTCLHFAARDGNVPVMRRLIEAGAKIDAVDVFGNTPLLRAVMGARSDASAIELLVHSGADPDLKNKSSVSPRALAERLGRGDVVALFAQLDGRRTPPEGNADSGFSLI